MTPRLENVPGEPIVTRPSAKFYCLDCFKTYQQCKVYMSADTLKKSAATVRPLSSPYRTTKHAKYGMPKRGKGHS